MGGQLRPPERPVERLELPELLERVGAGREVVDPPVAFGREVFDGEVVDREGLDPDHELREGFEGVERVPEERVELGSVLGVEAGEDVPQELRVVVAGCRVVVPGWNTSELQMVRGSRVPRPEASWGSLPWVSVSTLLVINRPPPPLELMALDVQMGVRGATTTFPVVYTSPPLP
jgi:hypothetical protein